jgi:serine/threonine-protein kinase
MAVEDTVKVAIQLASALAAAHRRGILKPDNVMMTAAGAKLLDFGVANRWRRGLTTPARLKVS